MLWMRSKEVRRVDSLDISSLTHVVIIAGGTTVVAIFSAEDGDGIVKTALEAFGSVHALIANAGILQDTYFTAMSEKEWDDVSPFISKARSM
jgi:multifunctional beta-oxidation protein